MAEQLAELNKEYKTSWTFAGEITTSSGTSTDAIDWSQIPDSATEVLIEMGWRFNNKNYYAQSHIFPKYQLSNMQSTMWNYSVGSSNYSVFAFDIPSGKIEQFVPYASIVTVYVRIYYR